jgi:hypothetical protein
VLPTDPVHVVVDVDETAPTVIVGTIAIGRVAAATDAVAVDPDPATVVTLAQRTCAVTTAFSVFTHGVEVVEDDVVETAPVSGVGAMLMIGIPSSVAVAVRP